MSHFLTQPGEWTGSGLITFSKLQNKLPFDVLWSISKLDENRTRATQKIVLEKEDPTTNVYIVTPKNDGDFEILLENEDLGIFSGKGVSDLKQIAWEFAHFGSLEGLEVYRKESDERYEFTAEYTGGDGDATKIEGTLQKSEL
jgi:hypothetical protein